MIFVQQDVEFEGVCFVQVLIYFVGDVGVVEWVEVGGWVEWIVEFDGFCVGEGCFEEGVVCFVMYDYVFGCVVYLFCIVEGGVDGCFCCVFYVGVVEYDYGIVVGVFYDGLFEIGGCLDFCVGC